MAEEIKPEKKKRPPNPNWLKATEHCRWKKGQSGNPKGTPNIDAIRPFQFKPGNCANPGGRPKEKLFSRAVRNLLGEPVPGDEHGRTYAVFLAERYVNLAAVSKDPRLIQMVIERAEGKPLQPMSLDLPASRDDKEKRVAEMLTAMQGAKS